MPKTLIILCCFPHSREIFPSDPLYNKYYTKQESEFSLDVFHRIGLNTGNYFFNEALVRHMGIDNCLFLIESEIVKEESRATVEALLDQADTIVYPMANLIRGDEMPFHKKALRNLLTYTKKPIHLIGLGAQLNQEDRPNEDIS